MFRLTGVNEDGKACVFPFLYEGIRYYTCIDHDHNVPWCGTSTTEDADTGHWIDCGKNNDFNFYSVHTLT